MLYRPRRSSKMPRFVVGQVTYLYAIVVHQATFMRSVYLARHDEVYASCIILDPL